MKRCTRKIGPFDCCTVLLGECEKYLRQIPPGAVDLVVTDPPFGMEYKSHRKEHHRIHGDDRFPVETINQLIKMPRLGAYFFCRWDNLWEHHASLPKPKSVVTWVKPGGSAGDTDHEHGRAYEMILFYPAGPNHRFLGRPTDVLTSRKTGNLLHPTQKPTELIMQMLQWYDFETVLDPYMGSGSTARAAKELNKHFLGFEIDEEHYEESLRLIDMPLVEKSVAPAERLQPTFEEL
jgi:site-specific DNA-methyltransferase (adenine-specific)